MSRLCRNYEICKNICVMVLILVSEEKKEKLTLRTMAVGLWTLERLLLFNKLF